MDPNDALIALAQFALALAGFTGVVISFGWSDEDWHAADAFRTLRALIASLGAAFLALVPIAIQVFGVTGEPVWRWSSAVFALHSVVWFATDAPRHWRKREELQGVIPAWGPIALYAAAVPIFVAQVLNALGVWFAPQPGVYFVGLLIFLLLPATIFARIPFVRPPR